MQNLHDKLVNSLKALNQKDELTYLIKLLNERKINNYAEAAILIFLLVYDHPNLMSAPLNNSLQKLCQDCYRHVTTNQLFALLSKPENQGVKQLFDQFIFTATRATTELKSEKITKKKSF